MNPKALRTGLLTAFALILSQPVLGQDIGELAARVLHERGQALKNVDVFVKRIRNNEIPGMRLGLPGGAAGACVSDCVVFKVEDVQLKDGTATRQERALTPLEVQTLAGISPEVDMLNLFGAGMIGAQAMLNREVGGPDIDSVLSGIRERDWEPENPYGPEGVLLAESQSPWLNPYRMLAGGGLMALDAAAAVGAAQQSLATSQAQAQAEADKAMQVYSGLELAGSETIDGRQVQHYSSSGQNVLMESSPEREVYFNGADVWIDPEKLVFVGHRIDGTMQTQGESQQFFIDVRYSDFRDVPGCSLYEPYRRVMSMGGMMNAEQMAQMEEARRQLADFERQMASMPPNQRQMLERMMGGQMNTIRSMANSGALEYVEETEEILCNPDLKALFGVTGGALTVNAAPTPPEQLLRQIQRDLSTLGYEPGNTDGVLDVTTQVAISQYQAEREMAVTGEPSQALAEALAADVARRAR